FSARKTDRAGALRVKSRNPTGGVNRENASRNSRKYAPGSTVCLLAFEESQLAFEFRAVRAVADDEVAGGIERGRGSEVREWPQRFAPHPAKPHAIGRSKAQDHLRIGLLLEVEKVASQWRDMQRHHGEAHHNPTDPRGHQQSASPLHRSGKLD